VTLLVDAGNTRIRWAGVSGGAVRPGGCETHAGGDPQALLERAWSGLPTPRAVLVANVAGEEFGAHLRAWTTRHWGVSPQFVVPRRAAFGVVNAYRVPRRLGADRWAALVATRHRIPGPACVVDCGTAITMDVLSAKGEHLGGLIVPGIGLMRRVLVEHTAGVPDEPDGEVSLLARDTRDAVTGGTLYAAVAVLDRVVGDVAEELGPGLVPVITGGDAARVLPLLRGRYRHEPDLVLEGLALIAGDLS
jgi:type III pantothenate kinase